MGADRAPGPGAYARTFLANWRRSRAPVGRKLWLVLRNRARAAAPPFCCGHPGEPGC